MDNITPLSTSARAYPVGQAPEEVQSDAASLLGRASDALIKGDLAEAHRLHMAAGRKLFVLRIQSRNHLTGSALEFSQRNAREKAVADA